jgi:hypothetical protein
VNYCPNPSRHSQIRGIQKKRYNKVILKPDLSPDWNSFDMEKKSGLIDAIGRALFFQTGWGGPK